VIEIGGLAMTKSLRIADEVDVAVNVGAEEAHAIDDVAREPKDPVAGRGDERSRRQIIDKAGAEEHVKHIVEEGDGRRATPRSVSHSKSVTRRAASAQRCGRV